MTNKRVGVYLPILEACSIHQRILKKERFEAVCLAILIGLCFQHYEKILKLFEFIRLSINVTQYTSAQSFFILKQGYMFRLKVSHLQALTTFSVTRCCIIQL